MMDVAIIRGGLEMKPPFPHYKEPKGRDRFMTDEEEALFLQIAAQWGLDDITDAFVVLIESGMRPGELWSAGWEMADLKKGVWRLPPETTKTDRYRVVPILSRSKAILAQRRTRNSLGRPFPYTGEWFRHHWDRVRSHMGMALDKEFVPYLLRHTCASRLAQQGMHIGLIQDWLGHTTIVTTRRYVKLAPSHLIEAAEVFERRRAGTE